MVMCSLTKGIQNDIKQIIKHGWYQSNWGIWVDAVGSIRSSRAKREN